MPGINLLMSAVPVSEGLRCRSEQVQHAMLHFPSFAYKSVINTEKVLAGITASAAYPWKAVVAGEAQVLLEGMIYSKSPSELDADLRKLADAVLQPQDALLKLLAAFVAESDGEFVLVVYDKHHQRVFVANDSLGRLPLFYAQHAQQLLVSREPKFIAPFLPSVSFKRSALMAYMMFGFCYGRDTLIEGMVQLQPSSILGFDLRNGKLTEKVSVPYTTEGSFWTNRSQVANEMRDRFVEGVQTRAKSLLDQEIVVSLSGGLDSRAVLAALLPHHPAMRVATMEGPESAHATEIGAALGVSVETIPAGGGDYGVTEAESIFLKDGLDAMPAPEELYATMDRLVSRFGTKVAYWTGAYGGELTRYLHLTSGISSFEKLTEYLLDAGEEYKYSTVHTAQMLGSDIKEARENLINYLASFPEKSPSGKYIRFRHEFDRKYTGNAEDRNRFYLWTTTPFTGLQFVNFVTSVREKYRKNTKLFRDFLRAIDPRTCSAPYYNVNFSLNGGMRFQALGVLESLGRSAPVKRVLLRANRMGKMLLRHEYHAEPLRLKIMQMLECAENSHNGFDVEAIRKIMTLESNPKGLSRIRTILSYMQQLQRFCAKF